MSSKFTPFSKMSKLELNGNPETQNLVLDIAPSMKNLTYEGEKYFRTNIGRRVLDDGEQAAIYLWAGYGKMMKEKLGIKTSCNS